MAMKVGEGRDRDERGEGEGEGKGKSWVECGAGPIVGKSGRAKIA